ncbi:extracellular solute-binding protein [Rhizobium sp. TRM95111]|uniref:extracellular solute-binding protein n=1 Tax=Rhizobium alarense TaxID=2846851 RepID=UPI001F2714E9|nr:extracellular solute-binding protein [Rhizobium alarense]MCF3640630.1 extracellular solute-binding protein [Rhizobium alarense]
MKTNAAVVAVAAALIAGTACAEDTLRLYNWADYFGETTLESFTRETGVPTSLDLYDSNDVLETRLLTGGSGFDVVFPATSNAQRALQAGALARIDPARLKNYGNLDPAILAVLDKAPGGRAIGVPYTWGTVGLAYNPDRIEERLGTRRLDSLDALFNEETAAKLADCGIAMIDSPLEVTAIALNYLGADPYSEAKADIEKAGALLETAAKHVRYFHSQRPTEGLASGDLCVALIYSGDALMAGDRAAEAKNGITVDYAIPKEGTMMWVDVAAIPADARHPELAYRFIDHLLRPEVIADVTNTVRFANANAAARPLVDPELAANGDIYPGPEVMAKLFPDRSIEGRALRERTRFWTRVTSGQ